MMPLILKNSSTHDESIALLANVLNKDKEALLQLLLSVCKRKTLNRIINCPTYPVRKMTDDLEGRLRLFKQSVAPDPYGMSNALAVLCESIIDDKRRKEMGQYFTPPQVAKEAIDLLNLKNEETVLDPGCGTGIFALGILRHLAQEREDVTGVKYLGIENDPILALSTAISLDWVGAPETWRVLFSDFLLVELKQHGEGFRENEVYLEDIGFKRIDAIIANPPYVRYHRLGERNGIVTKLGISMFSGLHSFFLAHSSRLLRSGRMVFLLPLEMEETKYGSDLLRRLEDRFGISRKSVCFDKKSCTWSVFKEQGPRMKESILNHESILFTLFQFVSRERPIEPPSERVPSEQRRSKKEITALLTSLALVHRGISTGANGFFVLTNSFVEKIELSVDARRRYLNKVIPTKIQLPNVFSDKCWNEYKESGEPCWLLSLPSDEPAERFPSAIKKYIRMGESKGIHMLPTCKNRKPWYHIRVGNPPNLVFTYMSRGYPRFVYNEASAFNLTNLLSIYWRVPSCRFFDMAPRVTELLNSDLRNWIDQKSVGRKYAGGLIKFEPGDLRTMPVSKHTLNELSPGLQYFSAT